MHSETVQVRVGELAVGALVHLDERGDRDRERKEREREWERKTDPQRVNRVKWVRLLEARWACLKRRCTSGGRLGAPFPQAGISL